MDITDTYEHYYIYKTKDYTFFTVAHGTLFKTDHILVDRASLNKYRKTEVTPCLLPEHRGPKLEIISSRKYTKYTNLWKMSKTMRIGTRVEIKTKFKNS